MHNAQCTMHNAQCTMHNAQCTMHNARCTTKKAVTPQVAAFLVILSILCILDFSFPSLRLQHALGECSISRPRNIAPFSL